MAMYVKQIIFDSPECFMGSKYFMSSRFVNTSSQIQIQSGTQQADVLGVRCRFNRLQIE